MTDATLAFTPQLDTDGTPYVLIRWPAGEQGALAPTAARRAALALLEAAEQADLESAMHGWLLRDQGGSDPAAVAQIIGSFRRYREQPEGFQPEAGEA